MQLLSISSLLLLVFICVLCFFYLLQLNVANCISVCNNSMAFCKNIARFLCLFEGFSANTKNNFGFPYLKLNTWSVCPKAIPVSYNNLIKAYRYGKCSANLLCWIFFCLHCWLNSCNSVLFNKPSWSANFSVSESIGPFCASFCIFNLRRYIISL